MELGPHVKLSLDSMPAETSVVMPTAIELRRTQAARLSRLTLQTPVWDVKDRTVPVADREIPIRIYTPHEQPQLPLLLYFHGGGFCIGSLDSHDAICRRLANELGWKVMAVDYRLAPEHPFPAGVEDCYAVTKWCAENASKLDVNPSRIAVGGDSSGANFATVVALMARDRKAVGICKQVLICPNTDYYQSHLPRKYDSYSKYGSGYLTTERGLSQFWSWYIQNARDASHPYVSPIQAEDLTGLPPALIITAEFDPLRDEGELYAERFREAGVPVVAIRYDGTIHGFLGLFADYDEAQHTYAAMAQFLRD